MRRSPLTSYLAGASVFVALAAALLTGSSSAQAVTAGRAKALAHATASVSTRSNPGVKATKADIDVLKDYRAWLGTHHLAHPNTPEAANSHHVTYFSVTPDYIFQTPNLGVPSRSGGITSAGAAITVWYSLDVAAHKVSIDSVVWGEFYPADGPRGSFAAAYYNVDNIYGTNLRYAHSFVTTPAGAVVQDSTFNGTTNHEVAMYWTQHFYATTSSSPLKDSLALLWGPSVSKTASFSYPPDLNFWI